MKKHEKEQHERWSEIERLLDGNIRGEAELQSIMGSFANLQSAAAGQETPSNIGTADGEPPRLLNKHPLHTMTNNDNCRNHKHAVSSTRNDSSSNNRAVVDNNKPMDGVANAFSTHGNKDNTAVNPADGTVYVNSPCNNGSICATTSNATSNSASAKGAWYARTQSVSSFNNQSGSSTSRSIPKSKSDVGSSRLRIPQMPISYQVSPTRGYETNAHNVE